MKKFLVLAITTLAVVLTAVGSSQARVHGGHGPRGGPLPAPAVGRAHASPNVGGHRDFGRREHFHHGFHGRAFIGVGPAFIDPWWYYPAPAYVPPPVVVEQTPPVYVQRGQGDWYYCPSSGAYYPNVPTCDQPWVPVPAQTP